MGILKIVCLLVFSLFLSLGNASAAGWTAGPGLTPSDDFPLFKTVERRLGLSTAKIPHSGKEFSIELHVFFNEEMDKAAERYLQALNRESGHRLSGWMDWQAGAVKPYISVVLLETMTYEGGAHPLNYVKGGYFECCGKSSDACRSEGSHAFSFCGNSSGCGSQGMHSPAHFHRRGGENHRIPQRILYRE